MPWLSRQNSVDERVSFVNDSRKHHLKQSVGAMVNFIPAQIDGLCGTAPAHHKQAPTRLLLGDLRVLMQNINCLPAMVRSVCSQKVFWSRFGALPDARDTVLEYCLTLMHIWMVVVAVPAFLLLPGSIFLLCTGICSVVTMALTWPLQGQRIVMSAREQDENAEDFSDERWIYVNGMMCR